MQTVTVNDVAIPHAAIAREVQNHAAESPKVAWEEATRALVIRELLLQRARTLDLLAEARQRPTHAYSAAGADGTVLRSAGSIAGKLG